MTTTFLCARFTMVGIGALARCPGLARRVTSSRLATRLPIAALALVALSSGLLRAQAADPTGLLRLLVPLTSPAEHGELVKLFPEAEPVQRDGRDYLMLGRYSDARQAYRAGRRLQQSVPVRFVITYPTNHPQADGRWIAAEEAAEAVEARQAAVRAASARLQQQQAADRAAAQARAAQLGPALQATSPVQATPAAEATPVAVATPAPAAAEAAPVAPPARRGPVLPQVRSAPLARTTPAPAAAPAPAPAAAAPDPQAAPVQPQASPVLVAALTPRGLLEPEAKPEPLPAGPEPVRAVVSTAPPRQLEAPAPEPAWVSKPRPTPAAAQPQPQQVALASPPPSRRRLSLVATNPELVYVFAELDSNDDLECLKQRMAVSDVVERNGKLLAQVGIYTTSRKGRQLRREMEERLGEAGFRDGQLGANQLAGA